MLLDLEKSNVNELTKALVIEQYLRMEEISSREIDKQDINILLNDKKVLEEEIVRQSKEIKKISNDNIELINIINTKTEINQKLDFKLQEIKELCNPNTNGLLLATYEKVKYRF